MVKIADKQILHAEWIFSVLCVPRVVCFSVIAFTTLTTPYLLISQSLVLPPTTQEPASYLREKVHHIFRHSIHFHGVRECASKKEENLPIRPETQTRLLLSQPIFLADFVCLIASNLYFLYLSSFSLNVEYYIFPQRMSIKIFFFNYCHRECFPLGKLKFNNFSSANLMIFLFLSWWLSSISSQLEIELNIKWLKENQNTNVPSWKANHIMKL